MHTMFINKKTGSVHNSTTLWQCKSYW